MQRRYTADSSDGQNLTNTLLTNCIFTAQFTIIRDVTNDFLIYTYNNIYYNKKNAVMLYLYSWLQLIVFLFS